jgi:hypothetical protein
MRRFVEQADCRQWTLLPERLDDFIDEGKTYAKKIADTAPRELQKSGKSRRRSEFTCSRHPWS